MPERSFIRQTAPLTSPSDVKTWLVVMPTGSGASMARLWSFSSYSAKSRPSPSVISSISTTRGSFLKTSETGEPITSFREVPVIFSADWLKTVTVRSRFTPTTPSARFSTMSSYENIRIWLALYVSAILPKL